MAGAIPVFTAFFSLLCFRPSLAQTTVTPGIGDYVAQGIGQSQDSSSSATILSTTGSSALAPNATRLYTNSSSTNVLTTATNSSVILNIDSSSTFSTTRTATYTLSSTLPTDSATSNSTTASTDSVEHPSVFNPTANNSTSATLNNTISTSTSVLHAASSSANGTTARPTASAFNGSVATGSNLQSRPTISGNHTSQYAIGPTGGLFANGTSAKGFAANLTLEPTPDAATTSTGPRTLYNSSAPWTVASNGSGAGYASRCDAEWQSWYSLSATANRPVSTYVYTSTYMVTNYSAPVTTICAGNTQINGPLEPVWSSAMPWPTVSSIMRSTITVAPQPSCSIQRSDCSGIGYGSDATFQVPRGCSATGAGCGQCTIKGSEIHLLYFQQPAIANGSHDLCASAPGATQNNCPYGIFVTSTYTSTQTFTGITATGSSTGYLDYTTSTYTDVEALEQTKLMTATYTETESQCVYSSAGPQFQNRNASSIVSSGVTYYDDRVYLSFKSVWAVNSCGSTVGTPRSGSLVAMPTSSVYSVCAGNSGGYGVPYNFADLTGEVPASAWNCQPYCNIVWGYRVGVNGGPSQNMVGSSPEDLDAALPPWPNDFYVNGMAVYSTYGGYCGHFPAQSWYKPWVVVPPQVRNLDPEWADCELAFEGWYDPPTVLTPQSTAAAITTPTAPSTTSSSTSSDKPAPAPTTAQPTSTPPPQTTQASATTSISNSPTVETSLAAASSSASSLLDLIGGALQGPATSNADPATTSAHNTAASSLGAGSLNPQSSVGANAPASQVVPSSPLAGAAPSETSGYSASPQDPPTTSNLQGSSVASSENGNPSNVASADPVDSTVSNSPASTIAAAGSSVQGTGAIQSLTAGGNTFTAAQGPTTAAPVTSPAATFAVSGQDLTAVQSGGSVVVAGPSTSFALAAGATTTLADETIVALPGGSGVAAGSSTALFTSAVVVQTAAVATASDGQQVTVVQEGSSSFVVQVGSTAATLTAGEQTSILGATVSIPPAGNAAVINGQTVAISTALQPEVSFTPSATVVSGTNGEVTLQQQGSYVIIQNGATTAAVPAGGEATVNSQTISIAGSGGVAVLNSQTLTLPSDAATTAEPQATITGASGQELTVTQQGSAYVAAGASSTVTIGFGSHSVIDGQTVSAVSGGGGVVANGQFVTLSPATGVATQSQAIVTASGGEQLTVLQQGSSAVVQDAGSATTIQPGSAVTIHGQTLSVLASGGGILANGLGVSLSAMPSATSSQVILTASDGQQLTLAQSGSSVVFHGAGTTTTLQPGSVATVLGQTISVPLNGGGVVADGRTMSLTAVVATALTQAVATGSDGQQFTILQSGSAFVVQGASTTATLRAGATTMLQGQTIRYPASGGGVVVNGQTAHFSTAAATVLTQAILTGPDGRRTTVEQQGASFLIEDGTRTATLRPGSSTVTGGQTLSAPTSSGALVVDGRTITLSATTEAIPGASASSITHTATSPLAPSSATPSTTSSSAASPNSAGLRSMPFGSLFAAAGLLLFSLAVVGM